MQSIVGSIVMGNDDIAGLLIQLYFLTVSS